MGLIDRLFGSDKRVKSLEKQVKALQGQNLGMIINATTSIYPNWQTIENTLTYTTVDDVYSVISLIADTAARIPMYRDWETDRKSTRLNSSHLKLSRMPSSA